MDKPIIYLTAKGKLGTLSSERKIEIWKDKYQIVKWWYQFEVIAKLGETGRTAE